MVFDFGMGFMVWYDVVISIDFDDKLDYVVFSLFGLYGIMLEDFGGVVGFWCGEIMGLSVGIRVLVIVIFVCMCVVVKVVWVKFGGVIVVLFDDDFFQVVILFGSSCGVLVVVVCCSVFVMVLCQGVFGVWLIGGNELFDVCICLQYIVCFV